jgi:radical SAM protein with 4Fe4S-binding SPASM domain
VEEPNYLLPPEYHVFERPSRYLIFDPQNFVWFVTDEIGKAAFDGLSKSGSRADAAASLARATDFSPSVIAQYVTKYIQYLLDIRFLHVTEYTKADLGTGILATPQILYMHLTSKCNLRCPYCYNQEHRTELIQIGRVQGQKEISTEARTDDLLRIVDEAAELGFTEIKLTGGEALLNKDAIKIACRAKSHGMRVNLLTNGTLVTEELAREIAQVVDSVSLSVDSDKPEEHDAVRGRGTHAMVTKAIHLLRAAGVKFIHVNAVFTPVNMNSVEGLLTYAHEELKADEVTTAGSAINVEDPAERWGAAKYVLTGEEYRHVHDQEKKYYENKVNSETPRPIRRSSLRRRHCGVGNGLVSIDPNGDIYPCQTLHHSEFLCGNAFKSGLKSVLENSGVLKDMKRAAVDILPECNTCPVRYVCAGGCRSEAYSREGDFLARNRAMCPTYFETALDQLWNAANIPVQDLKRVSDTFEVHPNCQ